MLVACPRCGSENRDGVVLCSNCGTVLPSRAERGQRTAERLHASLPIVDRGVASVSHMEGGELSQDQGGAARQRAARAVGEHSFQRESGEAGAQPYRRKTLQSTSFDSSNWIQRQAPSEWLLEPSDLGPLVVGPTTFGFMLLAAALLVVAAVTPLVVATAVDSTSTVSTILRYSPIDSAALGVAGVFVLLGRRRGWTILRLLVVLTALVGYLVWRYFTFGSIPIDAGELAIQHVRLGPAWYLSALGTAFVGIGFVSAVRGHF